MPAFGAPSCALPILQARYKAMTVHTTPPAMRIAGYSAVLSVAVSYGVTTVLIALSASADGLLGLLRIGGRGWLVGIGAGIQAGDYSMTLVPLGAVLLAILIVAWSVHVLVSEQIDEPVTFILTTSGVYAVLAAIGAAAVSAPGVHISFVRAAIAAMIVSALGASVGLATRQSLASGLPVRLRRIMNAAGVAASTVVAAATIIVLVLLAQSMHRSADLWASLDPGNAGGIGLALLCLLLAPNLIAWTVAAILGPGFAVGTQTSIDLTGADFGAVPGLPILAALPAPGEFPSWVFVLGLIPLCAGVVAGALTRGEGLVDMLCDGLAAGILAGIALGVLTGVSAGAVGTGRMNDIGPALLSPGMAAVGSLAVGGIIGAALRYYYESHYPGARGNATDRGADLRLWQHITGAVRRRIRHPVRSANSSRWRRPFGNRGPTTR